MLLALAVAFFPFYLFSLLIQLQTPSPGPGGGGGGIHQRHQRLDGGHGWLGTAGTRQSGEDSELAVCRIHQFVVNTPDIMPLYLCRPVTTLTSKHCHPATRHRPPITSRKIFVENRKYLQVKLGCWDSSETLAGGWPWSYDNTYDDLKTSVDILTSWILF